MTKFILPFTSIPKVVPFLKTIWSSFFLQNFITILVQLSGERCHKCLKDEIKKMHIVKASFRTNNINVHHGPKVYLLAFTKHQPTITMKRTKRGNSPINKKKHVWWSARTKGTTWTKSNVPFGWCVKLAITVTLLQRLGLPSLY